MFVLEEMYNGTSKEESLVGQIVTVIDSNTMENALERAGHIMWDFGTILQNV